MNNALYKNRVENVGGSDRVLPTGIVKMNRLVKEKRTFKEAVVFDPLIRRSTDTPGRPRWI